MSIWQDAARVIVLMPNICDKLTYLDSTIMRAWGHYDPIYLRLDSHAEYILFESGLPRYAFDLMVATRGVKSSQLTLISPFEHIRRRLLLKNVALETIMRISTSCFSEVILYLDMALENIHRETPGTLDYTDINNIALYYIWFMDVYDIKCPKFTDSLMRFLNINTFDKDYLPVMQMIFDKYTLSSCVTTQLCSKISCKKILEKLINTKQILFATFCIIVHEELDLVFKLTDLISILDLSLFLDACLYLAIFERECITLSNSTIVISDNLKMGIKIFLEYYEVITLREDDNYCIGCDTYYSRLIAILEEPELVAVINPHLLGQTLDYLRPFSAAL